MNPERFWTADNIRSAAALLAVALGVAACPALAADGAVSLQATLPASVENRGSGPWVDLAKALAWPGAVVILALWFRKPLAEFAAAVGSRVNKLSIAQLSIELADARATPASTPLLDEIRDPTRAAPIGDSSAMLLEQARSSEPADFATIDLGAGDEWLTSRLFVAAVTMERMRGVKVFVFIDRTAETERRFVATAEVRRLRWALVRRQPSLEVAYLRAQADVFARNVPATTVAPVATTDNGALEPQLAQMLVQRFIAMLQRPKPSVSKAGGATVAGWVALDRPVQERAEWVDRALLAKVLSPSDFETGVAEFDGYPAKLSRAVLRRRAPFVAVVDERGQFLRLIDRRGYLESLATQLGQEPT